VTCSLCGASACHWTGCDLCRDERVDLWDDSRLWKRRVYSVASHDEFIDRESEEKPRSTHAHPSPRPLIEPTYPCATTPYVAPRCLQTPSPTCSPKLIWPRIQHVSGGSERCELSPHCDRAARRNGPSGSSFLFRPPCQGSTWTILFVLS